jgi:hypothetical protein
MTLQGLADLREQHAASRAYFDVFLAAVIGIGLVLFVLLMKRSVAAKEAHVGAE